jgi:ubiquinone/menaquinone biosynthesis C-methylase UbiE
MKLRGEDPGEIRTEGEVCDELVPLARARVLELGCGKAEATRNLARAHPDATFTALETDTIQAALNLESAKLPNVRFGLGAAEAIPAEDAAFDAVLMFKSLHHVEERRLDQALGEIHRVLDRGGLAFFAEPVFDGDYNEVIRIFHDEERVRALAFAALQRAVDSGRYALRTERFFQRTVRFEGFAEFEKKVIGVTHTRHTLTDSQLARVRERFMRHATPSGVNFLQPMRVDVLQKV